MKHSVKLAASLIALAFAPAFASAGNCNTCGYVGGEEPVYTGPGTNPYSAEVQQVINNQLQLGNSIATLNVYANESYEGTTATGTAVGNVVSAKNQGVDMNVESTQSLRGNVSSVNLVDVAFAGGNTISSSVAEGNAGQSLSIAGNAYVKSQQDTIYGTNVTGVSIVNVGASENVASNAQAAGNNWNTAIQHGYLENIAGQYNSSEVSAYSGISAVYNTGAMNSGAVAAGNSNVVVGEASTIQSFVEQKNFGKVDAVSEIYAEYGRDVTSAANAYGNNASVTNKFGYAELGGYQENSNNVYGGSTITLHDWEGSAVSGSTAMGNSALLSNLGSDARLSMGQNNYGNVTSTANLFGSSSQGGVGMATSFAAGNTMTGFTCASCGMADVKMNGYANQSNYGNVTATTNIVAGSAGALIGSATAVGNSATFIAQRTN